MTAPDRWPDEMIQLLSDRHKPEPTATETAAYVGAKIAEYGAWAIILICLAGLWIGTP